MSTGLRRFRDPARAEPAEPAQRCELCAELLDGEHGHVVDLETRALMCACRGCRLLFVRPGQGRYRAVPDRFRYAPSFRISPADWDDLGIPVRTAFFFRNSSLGRTVAFYPSPAGATESELALDAWAALVERNPVLDDLETDAEALIAHRLTTPHEYVIAPVDDCYRLVGMIKSRWEGISGGAAIETAVPEFFAGLRRAAGAPA